MPIPGQISMPIDSPRVSTLDSPVLVWVIPTNEELMIALHVRDELRAA
jgi:acetate kinase